MTREEADNVAKGAVSIGIITFIVGVFVIAAMDKQYKTDKQQIIALHSLLDKQGFVLRETNLSYALEMKMGHEHTIYFLDKKSPKDDGIICFEGNCYDNANILIMSKNCNDCDIEIMLFEYNIKTKDSKCIMEDIYLKDALKQIDNSKKKVSLRRLGESILLNPAPTMLPTVGKLGTK